MGFNSFFFHSIFVTVIFQSLNQHDLVGAQDISHLKKIVFTILSRLHEDKAYKTAYEVRDIGSLVKSLGSGGVLVISVNRLISVCVLMDGDKTIL